MDYEETILKNNRYANSLTITIIISGISLILWLFNNIFNFTFYADFLLGIFVLFIIISIILYLSIKK